MAARRAIASSGRPTGQLDHGTLDVPPHATTILIEYPRERRIRVVVGQLVNHARANLHMEWSNAHRTAAMHRRDEVVHGERVQRGQCRPVILRRPIEGGLFHQNATDVGILESNRAVPGVDVRVRRRVSLACALRFRQACAWRPVRITSTRPDSHTDWPIDPSACAVVHPVGTPGRKPAPIERRRPPLYRQWWRRRPRRSRDRRVDRRCRGRSIRTRPYLHRNSPVCAPLGHLDLQVERPPSCRRVRRNRDIARTGFYCSRMTPASGRKDATRRTWGSSARNEGAAPVPSRHGMRVSVRRYLPQLAVSACS